ncbi:MAG: hypothetical protein JW952_01545 [Candidatus Eisenbacteria bacterium]|nr:hypothetical protein [Candidatus Eisenbacteria bacterium]
MRVSAVFLVCVTILCLSAVPLSAQVSWQKYAGNPVVVGTWAQINAPCVIFDDADGLYKMWFNCGTGYTDWQIHYATSPDGLTWADLGPVLPASTYSPCVLKVGGVFHMWYCRVDMDLGLGYFTHATSVDGMAWTNAGRKYYYSGPSVVYEGGMYRGWFGQNGRIYYSTSSDGMTWGSFAQVMTAPAGWAEVSDPCVLRTEAGYEMWFTLKPSSSTALYIGYATSGNGTTWNAWPDPVLSPGPETWDSKYVLMPAVLRDGTVYRMWYPGADDGAGSGEAIGYAGEMAIVVPRVVPATVDFDPNTLNLKSNGKWVTCYIELPEGYNVIDIPLSSVMLNNSVHAAAWPWDIGDYDADEIADLMVKFDRSDVAAVVVPGADVEVAVTGELGKGMFSGKDSITVIDPPGSRPGQGGVQSDELPLELLPNPFNPSVRVEYGVPEPASVLVQILTVNGRVVCTLENTQRSAGTYAVEWNGKDSDGRDVSSGLYICRLVVGPRSAAKKLTLLK